MRRIGILTGGGDCPGLNAVIRSVVEKCIVEHIEVFGFYDGWRGVIQSDGKWMTLDDVEGIQTLGGTILGSSRTNVMKIPDGLDLVKATMEELGLEAIVAIGGDDTLGVANRLQQQGFNMVGVPKTIDNDLNGTDFTFGFDTASNITMRALDDLRTTAASHSRVMVVEIMGRHTGWIAVQAGIAGDAHAVIIPEFPMHIDEICAIVQGRRARGKKYSVIACAEAAVIEGLDVDESQLKRDAFGNVAMDQRCIGERLAEAINRRTGIETRHVVLGHLQRGGNPTAFDRVLGARLGFTAAQQIINRHYGVMVGLSGTEIVCSPLEEALKERKEVDQRLYDVARLYFH